MSKSYQKVAQEAQGEVNMFSREQYKDLHNDVVKTGHPPVVRRGIHALLQLQLLQVVVDVAIDKGLSFSQVRLFYCYCVMAHVLCRLTASVCFCMPLCPFVLSFVPRCGRSTPFLFLFSDGHARTAVTKYCWSTNFQCCADRFIWAAQCNLWLLN